MSVPYAADARGRHASLEFFSFFQKLIPLREPDVILLALIDRAQTWIGRSGKGLSYTQKGNAAVDRDDFAVRVTAAEPTLYHISKSILKNDCDCADAVQEAIVTAYSKLHSLRDERYFKTWLCRILIHECYRIYHASRKVISLEEAPQAELSQEQSRDSELFTAIMTLKEEFRLVIVLHYVEGFQVTEIAGMLKIPEGTVKSRLSRARTELRSVLEEKEVLVHGS